MKALTYFVPVDFSHCSYNALQYATMLARFSSGRVKLCHVIDLDEVPESDNQVVVSFALDKLTKKAKEKMKSLIEIISLKRVTVDEDIVIGDVQSALMKQIDRVMPEVIVLGRNSVTPPRKGSLVSYITRNTKIPVLVVPGTHNPQLPNRAVLATDMRSLKEVQLAPLIEIVKKNSQELYILDIKAPYHRTEKDIRQWGELLQSTYGIKVNFLQQENNDISNGLMDFIRSNKVDLLCTVKPRTSFFDKIFRESVSNPFTNQVEVPVLVLND